MLQEWDESTFGRFPWITVIMSNADALHSYWKPGSTATCSWHRATDRKVCIHRSEYVDWNCKVFLLGLLSPKVQSRLWFYINEAEKPVELKLIMVLKLNNVITRIDTRLCPNQKSNYEWIKWDSEWIKWVVQSHMDNNKAESLIQMFLPPVQCSSSKAGVIGGSLCLNILCKMKKLA